MLPLQAQLRLSPVRASHILASLLASLTLTLAAPACEVVFRGEARTFGACRTGLADKFDVYWDLKGKKLTTLFTAEADDVGGYVAWGWGHKDMVPGDAVVVHEDQSGGEVVAKEYMLMAKSTAGVHVMAASKITGLDAEVKGKRLTGLFTRSVSGNVKDGETDAIWASGPAPSKANELSYHGSRGTARLDLSLNVGGDGESASSAKKLTRAWKVHAWLMAISWLLLTPLAIMSMRFGRRWLPYSFRFHHGGMVVVAFCALSAFLIALVEGSRTHVAHFSVGCIVILLTILQVVGGSYDPERLFIPTKESVAIRKLFYLLHSNVGRLAWLLAVINCFLGLRVADASMLFYKLAGIAVSVTVLVFGVLSSMPKNFPLKERVGDSDDPPKPA